MRKDSILKNQCSSCNQQTNHVVKSVEHISRGDEGFNFTDYYAIVECLGCNSLSFRREYWDSASPTYFASDDNYDDGTVVTMYPAVLKEHKRLEDVWLLPHQISLMYEETIKALTANCYVLAGAGFRAIIEAVCLDKGVRGDDLEAKITNLEKKHFITKNESSRLHSIRFIGNDSIHEMKAFTLDQLDLVLDITEHLLNNLYLIDKRAKHKLESIITEYFEFRDVLSTKTKRLTPGVQYSLYNLFGKDVRRIKEKGQEFENELVKEINAGTFTVLSLAPVDSAIQVPTGAKTVSYKFIITGNK